MMLQFRLQVLFISFNQVLSTFSQNRPSCESLSVYPS